MFSVPVRPVLNSASVPAVTEVAIVGLLIVSVPALLEPKLILVAEPPTFKVVATVLNRLAVAWSVLN